jgi:hypothetical protein
MNPSVRTHWMTAMALFLAAAGKTPGQPVAEPGLVATAEFVSERVHRGLERADRTAHVGIAWHGEAWRASGHAFTPVRSDDPAEWQLTAGWGRRAGANLAFESTLRWTHFTRAQGGMAEDTWEAGIAATWALPRDFKLTAAAYRDFTVEGDTAEGSLAYSVPLTRLGAYLDLRAYVGWSDGRDWRPHGAGARVAGGYGYHGVDAELPYRVGELTSVVLGVAYSEVWNAREEGHFSNRGGTRNLVWRLGLRYDF